MKRLFLILNVISALFMGFSHAATLINPNTFWPASFAGILFPYLVAVNLFFLIFWLFAKVKYIFISLILIAACWSSVRSVFAYASSSKTENGVRIMTYNVKNFDLYNWSKNKQTRSKMLDLIEKERPDILCLQEFFWHPNTVNDNINELKKRLSMPYYHYEEVLEWKDNHWGTIIFSRFPIKEQGRLEVNSSKSNISIFTDLEIDGKEVRIFNLHLQSIFFEKDDYSYLKDVSDMKNPDPVSALKIMKKMKVAYKKRAEQVDQINELLNLYHGQKIICGDFNDTPVSFVYKTLSHGLQDAFLSSGSGLGKTFVSKIPNLRIDYILLEEDFEVHSYKTVYENLSDHYPVIVEFSIP